MQARTVDGVQGARLGGLLQAAQRVGDQRDAAVRELAHVRPQLLLPVRRISARVGAKVIIRVRLTILGFHKHIVLL